MIYIMIAVWLLTGFLASYLLAIIFMARPSRTERIVCTVLGLITFAFYCFTRLMIWIFDMIDAGKLFLKMWYLEFKERKAVLDDRYASKS